MTITICCVCGVYYHCVKKCREWERGGRGISGRWLMVDGPALYVRWQGKGSCVLFCQCIQAITIYVPHSWLFTWKSHRHKMNNDLYWQGKTEAVGERSVPLPLCPLQISHGLVWVWTWAFVLKGELTGSAMAGWKYVEWSQEQTVYD
jgi:hypothetical protein